MRKDPTVGSGHGAMCESELTSHGHTPCRCGERRVVPMARLIEDAELAVNAIGDLRVGRFGAAVDPVRWVEGVQSPLRRLIAAIRDSAQRELPRQPED
jgi:hypothetical protein